MNFKAKIVSPLEKVFYEDKLTSYRQYRKSTALVGEIHDFAVAYCNSDYTNSRYCSMFIRVQAVCDVPEAVKLYTVEHVPGVYVATPSREPDRYARHMPGLFPDLLVPLAQNDKVAFVPRMLNSLWVELDTALLGAGDHKITVVFSYENGTELFRCSHTVHVIGAALPAQNEIVTQWFHTDCLADYYGLRVFSTDHWRAIENHMRVYVAGGNTMAYTPLFTPPLDTNVGGERTTTQLVDVFVAEDGSYSFNFDKLHTWFALCRRCGVKYYEMSHLFTQWGAFHAPKIVAAVGGKKKKIFGWDTDSHGAAYEAFLAAFLPALTKEIEAEGLQDVCYFHISDEPTEEHLESYRACNAIIRRYLSGYKIMDAMGNIAFYDEGLVDVPVPYIGHAEPFMKKALSPRFIYYCGTDHGCMGRGLAMPSSRNRITGAAMYANGADGFLHWGYNFYNACRSVRHIDPFFITDADKHFCAGDSFLAYPGENLAALTSVRYAVFRAAMQDLRALKLCEALCGKEAVQAVICELNEGKALGVFEVPANDDYTLLLRERINGMIADVLTH